MAGICAPLSNSLPSPVASADVAIGQAEWADRYIASGCRPALCSDGSHDIDGLSVTHRVDEMRSRQGSVGVSAYPMFTSSARSCPLLMRTGLQLGKKMASRNMSTELPSFMLVR